MSVVEIGRGIPDTFKGWSLKAKAFKRLPNSLTGRGLNRAHIMPLGIGK